jgi:tRNA threonylcarbamoyladenosine biosynthesis protein TsaE
MQKNQLLAREVSNEKETLQFAAEAVSYFKPGATIFLYGNLGSGKTFLVREFVRLLGIEVDVTSPSFTIINRYDGNQSVNHIDLYRIRGEFELKNLGLNDLWEDNSINLIEWPQFLENLVDWDHFRLYIENDTSRETWRLFKLYHYAE